MIKKIKNLYIVLSLNVVLFPLIKSPMAVAQKMQLTKQNRTINKIFNPKSNFLKRCEVGNIGTFFYYGTILATGDVDGTHYEYPQRSNNTYVSYGGIWIKHILNWLMMLLNWHLMMPTGMAQK